MFQLSCKGITLAGLDSARVFLIFNSMEHLLEQVESRTEPVIKKYCEDWLSCEVTTLEKAFPYLPPSLMALLAVKASNKEKAAEVLEFLEENKFDGKWAQKPEVLLKDWMSDNTDVVPKVEKAYEYIMSEYKSTTLDQLESTGDLDMWQLKRLLPYLSAILISTLAEWVSEEQADQNELLAFLKEHYEQLKRATPSKLMEILKQQSAFGEEKVGEEEEDKEEEQIPLPSFHRIVPYLLGIVGFSVLIFWLNSHDLSSAADLVPWKKDKKEVKEVSNTRIWHLNESITLQLEGDDPLNNLVERLAGVAPDSSREFYLHNVTWKDTLLPPYYEKTAKHLQTLHRAFPGKKFHINIQLVQQRKDSTQIAIEERLNRQLMEEMPGLLQDNAVTYAIHVSRSDDWTPELSDELILHAEMEWSVIIRK